MNYKNYISSYMKMMYYVHIVHESMEYADRRQGLRQRQPDDELGNMSAFTEKKTLTNTIISFVSYLHGVLLVVVKQPPDV